MARYCLEDPPPVAEPNRVTLEIHEEGCTVTMLVNNFPICVLQEDGTLRLYQFARSANAELKVTKTGFIKITKD